MINQCLMFLRKREDLSKISEELDYSNDVALNEDALSKLSFERVNEFDT